MQWTNRLILSVVHTYHMFGATANLCCVCLYQVWPSCSRWYFPAGTSSWTVPWLCRCMKPTAWADHNVILEINLSAVRSDGRRAGIVEDWFFGYVLNNIWKQHNPLKCEKGEDVSLLKKKHTGNVGRLIGRWSKCFWRFLLWRDISLVCYFLCAGFSNAMYISQPPPRDYVTGTLLLTTLKTPSHPSDWQVRVSICQRHALSLVKTNRHSWWNRYLQVYRLLYTRLTDVKSAWIGFRARSFTWDLSPFTRNTVWYLFTFFFLFANVWFGCDVIISMCQIGECTVNPASKSILVCFLVPL